MRLNTDRHKPRHPLLTLVRDPRRDYVHFRLPFAKRDPRIQSSGNAEEPAAAGRITLALVQGDGGSHKAEGSAEPRLLR